MSTPVSTTIPIPENPVPYRHYYTLLVHLAPSENLDQDTYLYLVKKYSETLSTVREKCESFIRGENICLDAGIDIFCPNELVVPSNGRSIRVKTQLKCAMYFNHIGEGGHATRFPSGFHMYPRSSTGSSTPLRLANSVGIIDAGYRGELMGCFDNVTHVRMEDYIVQKYQRLLQICAPNLTYPIFPVLVNSLEELDSYLTITNERGAGGFGSTGV